MPRKLDRGIILGICELCKDTEIPEAFAVWTAISCVSACLERGCYVDQGHFVVFPNLYVVLAAGSARCRKTSAIIIGESLLRQIQPKLHILSQKSTPEALIGDLSGSLEGRIEEGASFVSTTSPGIIIADELSTFIDRKAFESGMIAILTKLYDGYDFDYRTRSRGLEMIKNPCLNILGGSTLHWIKEAIPTVAIGGGFTARIIFIHQERRRKNVAWPERTEKEVILEKAIVNDLSQVRLLRGPFGIVPKAKDLYCQEYCEFCDKSKLFEDPNMAGYAGRRHIMILKLAMCSSAALKDSREIDEVDIALAINWLTTAEQDMQRVLSAISSEPCGTLSEQLVELVRSKQSISKFEIVRHFRNKLTVDQVDILCRTLVEARFFRGDVVKGQLKYTWIGDKE